MSTISAGTTSTTTLIHSGDTTGSLVLKTNDTGSGGTTAVTIGTDQSFNFSATGQRITGDFSNATVANRVAFQSSTTNANTVIPFIPNGTGNNAGVLLYNNPDPTNASRIDFRITATEASYTSTFSGTGTYLPMTFYTGGGEKMRIDTSGNVGIGNTTVRNKLDVVGNTGIYSTGATSVGSPLGAQVYIGDSNYNTASYYNAAPGFGAVYDATYASAAALAFYTYAGTPNARSERMRIDSSGNVGIGTSSPGARLQVTNTDGEMARFRTSSGSNQPVITINASDSAATVGFATGGNASFPAMTFANGGSERMRIDSSGNLLVGTTNATAKLAVEQTSATNAINANINYASSTNIAGIRVTKYDNNTTTSQRFVEFVINAGVSGCGQINANGASTAAFGSYSDERLKENIVDLPSQLSNIMALRPVEFDYIGVEDGHQIGFIAQEMQEVYPDAVSVGNDEMLMITAWSKTEARLVKAIQEQQALIQQLQADVAALKGTS